MAAQPSIAPVDGFDYSVEAPSGNWTRKYVGRAFGPGHEETIEQLFNRTLELVKEHGILLNRFGGHPSPKFALASKRDEIAQVLVREFGDAIQIAGSPSFAVRLCRGMLTYQARMRCSNTVREELRRVKKRCDHNADLMKLADQSDGSSASTRSPTPLETPQPEVAPLTTPTFSVPARSPPFTPFTPAPMNVRKSSLPLVDFEFNCFPPHIGKKTPSCKIRAEQLFTVESRAELQLEDFRVERLIDHLQARNVISDLDQQDLMYYTPEGMITVLDDEDLQNAVRFSRNRGHNSIRFSVITQDDMSESTSEA